MVDRRRKCPVSVLHVLLAATMMLSSATMARAAYLNVFNIEGENSASAGIVTYATLNDMLNDTNRLGVFNPIGFASGQNVVGGGAEVQRVLSVPEPATLAILIPGILMLALLSRRRRLAPSSFMRVFKARTLAM